MAAVDRELGYAGVKTYLWRPGGAPFVLVLYRLDPPEAVATIEAARLGELRTAAASAVARDAACVPDATSLGVFGCGRQAAAHVVALREALPLERVVVHGRSGVADFCARHGCEPGDGGGRRRAGGRRHRDHVDEPVLRGAWLRPDALVLAIGANDPQARELDDEVLRRAALVVTDSLDAGAARGGRPDPDDPGLDGVRELHDVRRPGRRDSPSSSRTASPRGTWPSRSRCSRGAQLPADRPQHVVALDRQAARAAPRSSG